jgi:RecA/RadA recombinase
MPGVDVNLRAAIRAKIESDYGEHTMLPGNRMPRLRRLPIDDLALEYVTGGGVPFAHMTRMWGPFSSGKTTALMKMFYAAQNFGRIRFRQLTALSELSVRAGELKQAKMLADQAKRERELGALACLFVLAEKVFDPALPLALGVDLAKLEIVPNTRIEVIGDVVQQALGGYHVIGVDSTTATISLDELGHKDGIMGDLPMLRAKRWGYNMDWWRDRMTPENCIIFTSHSREKRTGNKHLPRPGRRAPARRLRAQPRARRDPALHEGLRLKRKPNGGLEEIDADAARGSATASAFGKFQPAGGVLVVRCEKNKTGVGGRSVLLHHDKRTGDFDLPARVREVRQVLPRRRHQGHLVDAAGRYQDPAAAHRAAGRRGTAHADRGCRAPLRRGRRVRGKGACRNHG